MTGGLSAALEQARSQGFLGPGDVAAQADHALGFVRAHEALGLRPPAALCDLGAGGGLPGLVLAAAWPVCEVVLLEGAARRCAFLRATVETLGWAGRVCVAEGRAEDLARLPELAGRFPLVTARSFGPPAVTAECAVRLLAEQGVLLVAEPPAEDPASRWPAGALAELGLGEAVKAAEDPSIVAIRRVAACPARFPRRVGVPTKRPLF